MNLIGVKIFMVRQRFVENGYITLISVLVASAAGLAVALYLLFLSFDTGQFSWVVQQSAVAKSLATACAEEALQQIRTLSSFSGSGNLNFTSGTCTYLVTNLGSENRTITVSSVVGQIVRKIRIDITQINPKIVGNWQEVAN